MFSTNTSTKWQIASIFPSTRIVGGGIQWPWRRIQDFWWVHLWVHSSSYRCAEVATEKKMLSTTYNLLHFHFIQHCQVWSCISPGQGQTATHHSVCGEGHRSWPPLLHAGRENNWGPPSPKTPLNSLWHFQLINPPPLHLSCSTAAG